MSIPFLLSRICEKLISASWSCSLQSLFNISAGTVGIWNCSMEVAYTGRLVTGFELRCEPIPTMTSAVVTVCSPCSEARGSSISLGTRIRRASAMFLWSLYYHFQCPKMHKYLCWSRLQKSVTGIACSWIKALTHVGSRFLLQVWFCTRGSFDESSFSSLLVTDWKWVLLLSLDCWGLLCCWLAVWCKLLLP